MGKESIIHTGASKDAHDAFVSTVDSLVIAGIGKGVLASAVSALQTSVTLHEGQHSGSVTTGNDVGKSGSREL